MDGLDGGGQCDKMVRWNTGSIMTGPRLSVYVLMMRKWCRVRDKGDSEIKKTVREDRAQRFMEFTSLFWPIDGGTADATHDTENKKYKYPRNWTGRKMTVLMKMMKSRQSSAERRLESPRRKRERYMFFVTYSDQRFWVSMIGLRLPNFPVIRPPPLLVQFPSLWGYSVNNKREIDGLLV